MTANKKKSKPRAKPKPKAGAVAKVWQTATKMAGAERKDILAALTKAGVNRNTALTQLGHFKQASPAERQKKLARWAGQDEPKTT